MSECLLWSRIFCKKTRNWRNVVYRPKSSFSVNVPRKHWKMLNYTGLTAHLYLTKCTSNCITSNLIPIKKHGRQKLKQVNCPTPQSLLLFIIGSLSWLLGSQAKKQGESLIFEGIVEFRLRYIARKFMLMQEFHCNPREALNPLPRNIFHGEKPEYGLHISFIYICCNIADN